MPCENLSVHLKKKKKKCSAVFANGSQRVVHMDSELMELIGSDVVREGKEGTELSHSVKR